MNICRTPTGQRAAPPRALPALTSERKVPIITSAISIAGTIRQHAPSIEKIAEILEMGNIALKQHLDHPSRLNGVLRANAKKRWVNEIFTQFGLDLSLNSINKKITDFIPQMSALIKEKLEEPKLPTVAVQNTANSQPLGHPGFCRSFTHPQVTPRDQEAASSALFSYSRDFNDLQPLVVEMGAHIALVGILCHPQATHRAKQDAVGTLVNLTLDAANHKPLLEAGVHIPLCLLLADQEATTFTKEWSAKVLATLASNAANHKPLLEAGVYISLCMFLADPNASDSAKEYAVTVLMNLSKNKANHKDLLDGGVHISLCILLADPKASESAKEYAAMVLATLAEDGANRKRLVGACVHKQLMDLLADQQATHRAKEYAARALLFLSFDVDNRQRLVDAGLPRALNLLFADQKASDSAKDYAASVLAMLAADAAKHGVECFSSVCC